MKKILMIAIGLFCTVYTFSQSGIRIVVDDPRLTELNKSSQSNNDCERVISVPYPGPEKLYPFILKIYNSGTQPFKIPKRMAITQADQHSFTIADITLPDSLLPGQFVELPLAYQGPPEYQDHQAKLIFGENATEFEDCSIILKSLPTMPHIEVTKIDILSPQQGYVSPGDQIPYQVRIKNTGDSPAENVQVQPPEGDFLSVNNSSIRTSPVAIDDEYMAGMGMLSIDAMNGVKANDFDDDLPGTTIVGSGNPQATAEGGSVTLQDDGSFDYTPPGMLPMSGMDMFTYILKDGNPAPGVVDENDAKVTLLLNQAPSADDQMLMVNEDNMLPITLTGMDPEMAMLSFIVLTGPSHGMLMGTAPNLMYTPDANFNGADEITFKVNDGSTDSSPGTISITVKPINDPPVVSPTPGPYTTNANMRLTIGDGPTDLLANANDNVDTDVSGSSTLTVEMGSYATMQGGIVTVTQSTGAFTYDPPPGFTGMDMFTYKVVDDGVGMPANQLSANVTVTFNVNGTNNMAVANAPVIWFINNSAGGTNMGTLENPFTSLASFNASGVKAAGDYVYVKRNATNYTGPMNLLNGMDVIGEGATASITAITGMMTQTGNATLPSTGGMTPGILTNGIVVAQNNVLRGIRIGNTGNNYGISGTNIMTLSISNVGISGTGGVLDLDNGTLQGLTGGSAAIFAAFSGSVTSGADLVDLQDIQGILTVTTQVNISTTGAGDGLDITVAAGGTFTANFNGGLNIDTNTGIGARLGDNVGTFNFNVSATGGDESITAADGEALQADGVNFNATFDAVNSNSSSTQGIQLDNISGNLTINSGSIAAATGTAFDVGGAANNSGGTANVVYAGSIVNTAGRSILIQELGGGSYTLSGNINDTGTGIQVSEINNGTTATVTFSGMTKTVNTATNTAITLSTNPNGTIHFTNGGLDIDVTTGTGFNATGGGTVNVTGSNNTILSTTGTAINFNTTNIGVNNVTFHSITSGTMASGPVNAILLNTTGTSGGLIVTGDGTTTAGGNSSGGTIQNTTGDAISLTGTHNTHLQNITISNTGANGINSSNLTGTVQFQSLSIFEFNVAGFDGIRNVQAVDFTTISIDDSHIYDSNNSHAGNAGFMFLASTGNNVDGQINIRDSEFNGLNGDALLVRNSGTGTIGLTVTGNNFHDADNTASTRSNTLNVILDGNGVINANIGTQLSPNTFTNVGRAVSVNGVINLAVSGTNTGATTDLNATVLHNTINSSSNYGGIRVILVANGSAGQTSGHDITISNNQILNIAISNGILIDVQGQLGRDNQNNNITVSNNTIGTNIAPVGGMNGFGLALLMRDDNTVGGSDIDADILIQNNTVFTNNFFHTFLADVRSGVAGSTCSMHLTVLGNEFTNLNAMGFSFRSRVVNDDGTGTLALDLNSNGGMTGFNSSNLGFVLDHQNAADNFLIEVDGGDAVVNTAGATYTDAQIETFLNARNNDTVSTPGNQNDFTGIINVNLP